jgi:hypothetical protein
MGEWHTYPTGCGYQFMRPIHGGDEAFEEECGSQSREREWGKKKEARRKNEEERGRRPMYNTRAPASLVPLVHYRAPGRLAPLLV